MKKIILVVLVPVLFLGCEYRVKNNGAEDSATRMIDGTNTAVSDTIFKCLENQQMVDDQCVCLDGYKANEKGVCIATEENKLAQPLTEGPTVIGENVWGYNYNQPVVDTNKVEVADATTWTEHVKLQKSGMDQSCTEYFHRDPMNCGDGRVYTGSIPLPNGCYCIRAVNCADGYEKSDTYAVEICISNSDSEGDF